MNIQDPDLELVVQDNSTTGELGEYLRNTTDDERLVYHYNPRPVSMIDNFECAVRSSSGRYLCCIGDDDGLNPGILEVARQADEEGWDAVIPAINVVYYWPGSLGRGSTKKDPDDGVLHINPYSADISFADSESELRRLVRDGGLNYFLAGIPRLYHGIVSRTVLHAIYETTGSHFGGLSPDVYIAVASAGYAKKVVTVNYPLTILGACEASATAQSERGEHSGPLENAPHFQHREHYQWSTRVPCFYCVETIWADSMVAALTALGRHDLLREFNTTNLAAHCILYYPKYFPVIIRDMVRYFRETPTDLATGMVRFSHLIVHNFRNDVLKRYRARIWGTSGPPCTTYHNVRDIQEAMGILAGYLDQNNPEFMDSISNTKLEQGI
ncbi:glycosyltransferase involved in cell wall biosynthesis [Methanolinea mesophila]|nr:glycosyltransferase involved in cell wall biosynthesis [Methanolinea mesophila]